MVIFNNCDEAKSSSAEAEVELELLELGKELSDFPDWMSSSKASNMEQDLSLDTSKVKKGLVTIPFPLFFLPLQLFVPGWQMSIFI